MKKIIFVVFVAAAMLLLPQIAVASGAFIPLRDGRTVAETITALESAPAWNRRAVESATGYTIARLRTLHEQGKLSIRPCGAECAMRTANTGNVYADPSRWRRVRPSEMVLYHGTIAILLSKCGNPVACEEECCVQVTARHQKELATCRPNGQGGVTCFNN